MMGFKIRIIKVMMGVKKSKNLNLKEKEIFRNSNGQENMLRLFEKMSQERQEDRKSLFEPSS